MFLKKVLMHLKDSSRKKIGSETNFTPYLLIYILLKILADQTFYKKGAELIPLPFINH